jgi:hypothetical protein
MHPCASQEIFPITFPFHALLFCFWPKMVEPAFITSHDVEQDVIILSNMSLKKL